MLKLYCCITDISLFRFSHQKALVYVVTLCCRTVNWRGCSFKNLSSTESEEGLFHWSNAEECDSIPNLRGLCIYLVYLSKSRGSIDLQKNRDGERQRNKQEETDRKKGHCTDMREKGREAIRQWEGKLQRDVQTLITKWVNVYFKPLKNLGTIEFVAKFEAKHLKSLRDNQREIQWHTIV